MARGGVNKVNVQKARQAILARGEHPSIDAVRVELGNTGSKTTIHRYLKELEDSAQPLRSAQEGLSQELGELVSRLAERLKEEGQEQIDQAQIRFDTQQQHLQGQLLECQAALQTLEQQFAIQQNALHNESAQLQTSQATLQTELTRNARLSQSCADLEVRLKDKDEHIQSLEEKHRHAREALEHYRGAVQMQREQEQRRHEGQVQQLQLELRQLQQTQIVKQDELTQLNRDNERLLTEARQQSRLYAQQDASIERLAAEAGGLKAQIAQAQGARHVMEQRVEGLLQEVGQLTGMVEEGAREAQRLSRELLLRDQALADQVEKAEALARSASAAEREDQQ
jgi:hypothetical protein